MKKEKICPVCLKVFVPTGHNQKICSKECAEIRHREWAKMNRRASKYRSKDLDNVLKEIAEYNERTNQHISYGQYMGLIYSKAGVEK
ncbi:MAG: hypothetical protein MJZ37_06285 [Bacilli bacterium]|nr:hypothetical protein [Bacilli bacterium]